MEQNTHLVTRKYKLESTNHFYPNCITNILECLTPTLAVVSYECLRTFCYKTIPRPLLQQEADEPFRPRAQLHVDNLVQLPEMHLAVLGTCTNRTMADIKLTIDV